MGRLPTPDERRAFLEKCRAAVLANLPVIIFFIVLYWVVELAFGSQYLLVVSPFTTLFDVRFRKYNSAGKMARLVGTSVLALLGARLAVSSPVACVIVNLLMPFLLVYLRASQANPRRYFAQTMLFAFLELRPENLVTSFATQAAVIATCCGMLIAALLVCKVARRHVRPVQARARAYVRRLVADLERAAAQGIDEELRRELLALRREFAELAYTVGEDVSVHAHLSNLLDMLATLTQRTAYLTGSFDWTDRHTREHAEDLIWLANLTRDLDAALTADDTASYQRLIAQSSVLLAEAKIEEPRFRIFFQSYLNMVSLIARTAADPYQRPWKMSLHDRARVELFRKRLSLDSFELRFSVRCGVVLAVSCLCNLLFPVERLYWFVLQAYLLLQPFPDESRRRMRTRMIGTVLGSVFVHAVALLNLSWEGVMVLGTALVVPLYSATPGSVASGFFATAYAVTMTSVSIDDSYAIAMRLISLVMAIVLVSLVNRLVMPTSDRRLFVANVRQMIGVAGRYWGLVRETLTERVDTVVSSETLLHFQMLHAQVAHFVDDMGSPGEKDREIAEMARYHGAAERMLFCLWELMCELEQLELLVRLGRVSEDERPTFEQVINLAERHCEPERFGTGVAAAEELLMGLAEPDVRYVLEQYIDRAGELRLAIDAARGALVEKPSYVEEVRG